MSNYIIEGNIDFYKTLNSFSNEQKEDNKNKEDKEDNCLISNEPLTKYYITLPCNHKFNYIPLFNAVYENFQLKHTVSRTLKCPYCKVRYHNQVLPYNPLLEERRVKNLNTPFTNSLGDKTCCYTFKSGKNKGNQCGKHSYWDYCHSHLKTANVAENKSFKGICVKKDLDTLDLKATTINDFKKLNMIDLRYLAKINKKKNYSKLKKSDLIDLLKSNE